MSRDEPKPDVWPEILDRPQISLVGDIDKFSVQAFLA